MKKACVEICLSFIVTLASFIILLVPASAGALTGVVDTPSDNLVGHTATHAVTFSLYSDLPKNGRIVIDFPGGFNVSGATLGANPYSILLYSIVGQEITLKKNTSSVSGGTTLSLSLQNIINTQTPGNNYHLTVRTTDINGDLIDGPTPSADFSILSGQTATLRVAGFPGVTSPGVSHNFTVTALDGGGNEATGYAGTVHFSSTDPEASLPGDHTFTAGDAGVHTFSAALNTAGIQSITATDISDGSITGTQSNLQVNIAVADTATAVESSDISSIYGDAVTFTATVSSQTGTPTGSVRFLDGASQLGTAVLAAGQATYTTPVTQLIAGNHLITAEYSGDSNYNASVSPAITQIVAARMLSITAAGVNKVYDGTTAATVTLSDNRVGSDTFTKTYSLAVFADKNAGTGKTVSVSGINVTGPDAGKYTWNTTASTTANISKRPLTIVAIGMNKVYDGTVAATVTFTDNRVGSDTFTKTYSSAVFADKNAGTGKTVNVSGINVTGPDAANYTWNTTASTTANISRAQPVISWTKPADISYPTPLTVSQLNASANIAGQFAYSPPAGTILNVGNNQTLQANFTPQDSANYSAATASTTINVLGSTWKIVFVSGSQQLNVGAVSRPIAVQIQNSTGTPVNVSENTLIRFSSTSASGKFDTSAAGKFDGSISSVSIAAGQNTASLYYKDASTGRPVITAASAGLIGASQQLQIKSPSDSGGGGGGGG
ncbi:MAG: hypothetical protein H6Q39_356, partial [Chloroflexi bacterium]|nr:hypothetical protein [Chloroflexota bacterium]